MGLTLGFAVADRRLGSVQLHPWAVHGQHRSADPVLRRAHQQRAPGVDSKGRSDTGTAGSAAHSTALKDCQMCGTARAQCSRLGSGPALAVTARTLLCCQGQSPHCLTGTQQAGVGPAALEITGFWHLLHEPSPKLPLCLVLCGCSFASLWITRVLWEMWRIKAGVAVTLSDVFRSSAVAPRAVGYHWLVLGCAASSIRVLCTFSYSSCIFADESGALSGSRAEEFGQFSPSRHKE